MVATRLAIIDLATGDQPLPGEMAATGSSRTGRSTTTSNCARSWKARSPRSTTCDTEVIANAYAHWARTASSA